MGNTRVDMNAVLNSPLVRGAAQAAREAAPALRPAVEKGLNVFLASGDGRQAAVDAFWTFANSAEGKKLSQKAATSVLSALDGQLRAGALAPKYQALLAKAGDPSTHAAVMKLFSSLGKDGEALGKATNGILRAFSKGGLTAAFSRALKLSPKLLSVAGKLAKALPLVGLVASAVNAIKVLTDPNASAAQKTAALVDLVSGVVGTVVPGSGLVTTAASIGTQLAADGFDAATKKGPSPA